MQRSRNYISQIIIDKKGDYGDLSKYIPKKRLLHLNVHDLNFKLGLQPPAGIAVYVWIQIIATLIAARGNLISSAMCLANMILFAVTALNPNPSDMLFPDFRLLYEIAQSSPPWVWAAKPEYMKTLLQLLETLAGCPYFQTFAGLDLERDVISQGKSCIIEIPTLYPAWLRLFIVDLIIAQILYGRIHRRQKGDATEVIIYLDEADQDINISSSDAAFLDSFSVLSQLLRMAREYRIMVVIGVGILGHLSDYISSSFQNVFVFCTSDGKQIYFARQILNLPPGAEQMLFALKPGEALLLQSQQAWPHAVWCKIDYVPPDRSNQIPVYDRVPFYIPPKSLSELPHVQEALKQYIQNAKRPQPPQGQRSNLPDLSENARKLLDMASLYPYVPVFRLCQELKILPASQITIQKELEDMKLAVFDEPRFGSRNLILLEITEAGWVYLNKSPHKRLGRGGITHRHICHWIHELGQKHGYKTDLEWIVPGTTHPVDCAWLLPDGKAEVFEVVSTCDENLPGHVSACLSSDRVSSITIVVFQKRMISSTQKLLGQFDPARIRFDIVDTYLKELWP
jgi:hypothetical protein